MRTGASAAALALLLGAAACTDNDALGNDREARLDPPEPPAEVAPPESLAQVEPGLLKPAPFSDADLASLPGSAAMCRFRYTDAGFPVLLYPAGGGAPAVLKLNGKLIRLPPLAASEFLAREPPVGAYHFAGGPVQVEVRHPDRLPAGEREEAVMILRLAGASDELGFAGAAECP